MQKIATTLAILLSAFITKAQVIGGDAVFKFLNASNSAQQTAMGGVVAAPQGNNILLHNTNPAYLNEQHAMFLGVDQHFYLAGSRVTNLAFAKQLSKKNITLATNLAYFNYGKMTITDNVGNDLGNMQPRDFVWSVSAAKNYKQYWRYGATLKFAQSNYGVYSSNGLFADAGIYYVDTNKNFAFGAVFKNVGTQLKRYNNQAKREAIPFDLQIGISKKLAKAPLRFNVNAHHLYQWNITYNNPLDIVNTNLFANDTTLNYNTSFAENLFRHLNFGIDLVLGKRLEVNVAYSHLQRGELSLKEKPGLKGFSLGAHINLNKFQIYYGRNIAHLSGTTNQIGVHFDMHKLFGFKK